MALSSNRVQITKKMRTTSVFSYKCILFFLLLQHYPSFIFNKSTKLIKFKILWSLFEHSKHF
ncbi:hypothetical protein DXA78_09525 [Bacteroides fragilis]|nr:hypothetical protein DXC49_04265 [Bacteroides fragilis]RGN13675.1 hypothetical protein DXB79_11700 [Bacteroides fragilis]RGN99994.1 hypothetical protein DXB33_10740 [Bacteroides fragilis]RGO94804.1 hypothetical protein DXA81_15385 [Bacteroides fragilis]RGP12914.1 hypothetical protein DXA78_09525 [Bacteroides fragilis]